MPGEAQYVTNDLSLAAYLSERGYTLRGARKDARGQYEFVMDDRDGTAHKSAVEWSNSCCRKHEARLRSLKSLVHSGRPNGNGDASP